MGMGTDTQEARPRPIEVERPDGHGAACPAVHKTVRIASPLPRLKNEPSESGHSLSPKQTVEGDCATVGIRPRAEVRHPDRTAIKRSSTLSH